MATHFHPIKVKEVIKETADCVSITFDLPNDLQQQFIYNEGQSITIKKSIDGNEVRRSYSICNAPFENELKVAVKKVNGGLFSTYANETLKTGDVLDIMPPSGSFCSKKSIGNFLGIAAGSGITPILSIIKHHLNYDNNNSFTLIYGNQSLSSIIFFEEIEAIKNKYMERFTCINILSRERTDADINYGRINENKLTELKRILNFNLFSEAFLCGPEEMVFKSSEFLQYIGLAKNNIHFELFATAGQIKNTNQKAFTADDNSEKSNITVKLDGRSFDFKLGYDAEYILDAALAKGADLPYACKGGVCCTCKAKLIDGKVKMDVNYALEEDEVEQGYILTCQSHPLTDIVVVDFDIK
jgi:ring-1,2-phenylacetyl-CoA epoxidase subunit PaaE